MPKTAASRGWLVYAAILILALMLATSGYLTFRASAERRAATEWNERTLAMLDATQRLRLSTLSIVRGERGFLLTGDESFLQPYNQHVGQIPGDIAFLNSASTGNIGQKQRLSRLQRKIDIYLGVTSQMIALQRAGAGPRAVARIKNGESRRAIEDILGELDRIERFEQQLQIAQASRSEQATKLVEQFEYFLAGVGLVMLAVSSTAIIALRRSLTREAQYREELRQIAVTDELTGLANRRELLSAVDRMIGAARRGKRPLSLAILDIDHFKRVNDTYGHPAGDEVIRRVAALASEMMREQDVVGRLGGEEFVIVFPDCSADDAIKACERLRHAIASLPILLDGGVSLNITLSFGIAQFCDDPGRASLIERADAALYMAKKMGRDQIRLAA